MKDVELIEHAIGILKVVRKRQIYIDTLQEKSLKMTLQTHTYKAIDKMNTALAWAGMHLDQSKTDFARLYKDSKLDVSPDQKEYHPSGFHDYQY